LRCWRELGSAKFKIDFPEKIMSKKFQTFFQKCPTIHQQICWIGLIMSDNVTLKSTQGSKFVKIGLELGM